MKGTLCEGYLDKDSLECQRGNFYTTCGAPPALAPHPQSHGIGDLGRGVLEWLLKHDVLSCRAHGGILNDAVGPSRECLQELHGVHHVNFITIRYTTEVAVYKAPYYQKSGLVQVLSDLDPIVPCHSSSTASISSLDSSKKLSGRMDAPSDPMTRLKTTELDCWMLLPI